MPTIEGSYPRPGYVTAGATGSVGPFESAGVPTTAFNGIAKKGALCTDTTNAKLYINTGTLAANTWTVVGTQT